MQKIMFILAIACCSTTVIAGSWSNEADLTAHFAYTDNPGNSARLMVDFALGNQCGPEVIMSLDKASLKTAVEAMVLQVDQRKQYRSTMLSRRDKQLLISFTEDTDKILKDLKAGNKVRVSAQEQTVQFSLSGSSSALAYAQKRCASLQ
jgi:hypothetical protein